MIHSSRYIGVLDTCVIYPIDIRDLLLWFASFDLYTPKWSDDVFREWKEVMVRKGISKDIIKKRIENVNKAFPDAKVTNYQSLIDSIDLPDKDDRHILAAAIKVNANVIVTNNVKHFPKKSLDKYNISAASADDFLTDIIDLNHETALQAFRNLVANRRNPPQNEYQVLDILRIRGLTQTADYIHTLL